MRTYLDCIPCFFKQALEAARLAGVNDKAQKKILGEVAKAVPGFSLASSPPDMARMLYGIVRMATGKADPYREIKAKSNKLALAVYGSLKDKVQRSRDRLLTAVELAIAGNIIDYGVKNSLDVGSELEKILSNESKSIKKEEKRIFAYNNFKKSLDAAKSILYLADNAGETVFDRILIEEIKALDKDKKIFYAVKEKPVINDALIKDAIDCGIAGTATVLSSGSDAPGTVLALCSAKFKSIFRKADMVISKGQGNFEALSRAKKRIFFLFMAKCPVVAGHVGCRLGDVILLCHPEHGGR